MLTGTLQSLSFLTIWFFTYYFNRIIDDARRPTAAHLLLVLGSPSYVTLCSNVTKIF